MPYCKQKRPGRFDSITPLERRRTHWLPQYVQAHTMNLTAIRLDELPVSFNAVALLEQVKFAGGRIIDVEKPTTFIGRH